MDAALKFMSNGFLFFAVACLLGCQGTSNIVYGARLPQKDKIPPNYSRVYDYSQSPTREKVEPWIVDGSSNQSAPKNRYRSRQKSPGAATSGDSGQASTQSQTVEPDLP